MSSSVQLDWAWGRTQNEGRWCAVTLIQFAVVSLPWAILMETLKDVGKYKSQLLKFLTRI